MCLAKLEGIHLIKRFKDETKLVAKWTAKIKGGYYFHVFLWQDQDSFDENTYNKIPNSCVGCVDFVPMVLFINEGTEIRIVKPKLGEVHFIRGKWNTEIVAHELCHVLIDRLRMVEPSVEKVIDQEDDCEEDVCYWFGRLFNDIYRLLWETDPPKGWGTIENHKD